MNLMKYAGVLLLACATTVARAGTHHYYYTDPQGTVLAKADASGTIIATYDYAPYGTAVASMSSAPSGPGYTGHVNDPDTGLVYMQARYYDPGVGRFLSVDPVGVVAGSVPYFNRFSYVGNNPASRIDPFGKYFCDKKEGCPNFDKAYTKVKDAAGAYSTHSAEGKAFSKVLSYYGDKGAKGGSGNSVFIKEGVTSTGGAAEIGHNWFTGSDTITIDTSYFNNGGGGLVEMAAAVAHEGQHGVDDAVRRKNNINESLDTVRSTEQDAYRLQSYVNQGLGVNSVYRLWRSDWPANEVETKRDAAIDKYSEQSVQAWLKQQ